MKKFTEMMAKNWPQKDVRISFGDCSIFIGRNCGGLDELKPEVIEFLDSHEPIHRYISATEVEWRYRYNSKLYNLIF